MGLERLGPGDDLDQLLGDVGLALPVVLEGELVDEVARVAGRVVHGGHPRALLAGGSHESRTDSPEGLPAQFWEAGVYENDYVREQGVWKIRRLDYRVQWQADYEAGWARQEAHLRPASLTFPEDPLGPDELLSETRPMWPRRAHVEFHYAHPVIQQALR